MIDIQIVQPYDKLIIENSDHELIWDKDKSGNYKLKTFMYSPRISGKTKNTIRYIILKCIMYPFTDIILSRCEYASLKDSLFTEIQSECEALNIKGFLSKIQQEPLHITTAFGNEIYFKGVGGSDKSRVRGMKPKHPVSLIFFDEAQQMQSQGNLDHAVATWVRSLGHEYPDTELYRKYGLANKKIRPQIIIAGNPEEVKGHWWNIYCKKMRYNTSVNFIDANYLDMYKLLNEETIGEIEMTQKMNPNGYKFMYLGNIDDVSGGAYSAFRREWHYLDIRKWKEVSNKAVNENGIKEDNRIYCVIYGGDGAIAHDSTCLCPIAILRSGRAVVLERFFYDPLRTNKILAPSELGDLMADYLEDMDKKYHFTDNGVPLYISFDGAAADLIAQLRYIIDPQYYLIYSFKKKNVIRNNGVVNDAFFKNVLTVLDFGKQQIARTEIYVDDPLLTALESVVWKGYKLDPLIPNDATDALTYGINMYYENPEHLYFPEREKYYLNCFKPSVNPYAKKETTT